MQEQAPHQELYVKPICLSLETPIVEVNGENREIQFVACKETPIIRYDWFSGMPYYLTFEHSEEAVNLSRVASGQCMFLSEHTGFGPEPKRIGKVVAAELKDGQLLTTHRINKTVLGKEYWSEVESDTQPGVSVEIDVQELEVASKAVYVDDELIEPAHLKATKWELLAIASANIPAVVGAGKQQASRTETKHLIKLSGESGYEHLLSRTLTKEETMAQQTKTTEEATPNTQLEKQVSDLQAQLSAVQSQLGDLQTNHLQLATQARYWQLRAQTLQLHAFTNQCTRSQFNQDFNDNPEEDLQKLSQLSDEDARIELRLIERSIQRLSQSDPIERVDVDQRSKVSKAELKSSTVEGNPGAEPQPEPKSPSHKLSAAEYGKRLAAKVASGRIAI